MAGAFWSQSTNTFMLLWYELLFVFLVLLILLGEGLLRNGLANEQCWRLHMTCCSCIGVWSLPLCCSFVVKFWFFSYFVPSLFWQPIKTITKLGSSMMRTLYNQCEARQQEVCICISNWFVFRKCTYPNSLHLYMYTLCMIWKSIYDRSLLVSFKQDFCFLDK